MQRVRELGWLAVGGVLSLPAPVLLVLTLAAWPLRWFDAVTAVTRRLADAQRRRASRKLPDPIPTRDATPWRDLLWLVSQFVVAPGSFVLAVTLWLTALQCFVAPVLKAFLPEDAGYSPVILDLAGGSGPTTWLLVPVGVGLLFVASRIPLYLIRWQIMMAAALLSASVTDRLAARVERLTADRTVTVDASAAELRRIERDLHDGAQARLVAVAMNLGVAEDLIDQDPEVAKAFLAEARTGASEALVELRGLVRGIHPPMLADRGLTEAVRALALGHPIPVTVYLAPYRRPAAPLESAAYFATAECLANVLKHADATTVRIVLEHTGAALRILVEDNGRGGADPAAGTGLKGIRRRLSAFDGTMLITSPPGGPTTVTMELPCAS